MSEFRAGRRWKEGSVIASFWRSPYRLLARRVTARKVEKVNVLILRLWHRSKKRERIENGRQGG